MLQAVEWIAAVIGTSVTMITIASLSFANKIHARMVADENRPIPTRASIDEKRRVLERDRKEWVDCLDNRTSRGATKAIDEINRKLIALADEESRIQEADQ